MSSGNRVFKVGFGPETDANSFTQSGVKVAAELEQYSEFETGFFRWDPYDLDELMAYDVLVFIKYIPDEGMLRALRDAGKVMVLDYQDTFLYPSVYETDFFRRLLKKIYYWKTEGPLARAFRLLDGCLICTPLLRDVMLRAGMRPLELPRQIYNDENEHIFKKATDRTEGVVLYWTGVWLNQPQNDPVLPVLKRMHDNYGCRILYDTNRVGEHDWIEYRMFSNETWYKDILDADVAFRWRDASNMQHFKDANKVQGYMAAGLPAVVHPTASEKLVVTHGETGFFAETPEAFEAILIRLVKEPELRRRVGQAAHKEVWAKCSLKKHVEAIREHLLELLGKR